jgi:hypothetical protein
MKRLIGHISIVQEQRFRILTDDGRGFLLTLFKHTFSATSRGCAIF